MPAPRSVSTVQPPVPPTGSRLQQRPRGRAVGRGRGSAMGGVIVGSRPLVHASVVPDELVNQVILLLFRSKICSSKSVFN